MNFKNLFVEDLKYVISFKQGNFNMFLQVFS